MGKGGVKRGVVDIEDLCATHRFDDEEVPELRRSLLAWFDAGHREMPWRKPGVVNSEASCEAPAPERSARAYEVLVSEVMLQQTQVSTVVGYYNRWMRKWPSVKALAAATVEEVNEMWSGLGARRAAATATRGGRPRRPQATTPAAAGCMRRRRRWRLRLRGCCRDRPRGF